MESGLLKVTASVVVVVLDIGTTLAEIGKKYWTTDPFRQTLRWEIAPQPEIDVLSERRTWGI
jgi:hypothetical protein